MYSGHCWSRCRLPLLCCRTIPGFQGRSALTMGQEDKKNCAHRNDARLPPITFFITEYSWYLRGSSRGQHELLQLTQVPYPARRI
jgi:hypothetical protein